MSSLSLFLSFSFPLNPNSLFQAYFPGIVHVVYVLRPSGFFQKAISEVRSLQPPQIRDLMTRTLPFSGQHQVLQGRIQVPVGDLCQSRRPLRARREIPGDPRSGRRTDVFSPRMDPAEDCKSYSRAIESFNACGGDKPRIAAAHNLSNSIRLDQNTIF